MNFLAPRYRNIRSSWLIHQFVSLLIVTLFLPQASGDTLMELRNPVVNTRQERCHVHYFCQLDTISISNFLWTWCVRALTSVVSDPWLEALYGFGQFVLGSHLVCHLFYRAGSVRGQGTEPQRTTYTATHLTISILFGVVEPQGSKLLQHLYLLHLQIYVMDTQACQKEPNVHQTPQRPWTTYNPTVTSGKLSLAVGLGSSLYPPV